MGIKLEGVVSGTGVEVDSNNQLKTTLTDDVDKAGFSAIACESSSGEFLSGRVIRSGDITHDYRIRMGADNIVFNEWFAGTTVNSTIWATPQATATVVQAGGFLTLNNSGSTTATQGCIFRSWRTFPVFGTFGTYFEFLVQFPNLTFNNAIAEIGAALTASTAATAPVDGAFFRFTASGLEAVLVNNTSEIVSTAISSATLTSVGITLKQTNHYIISVNEDIVEFWINDYMVASIPRPIGGITPTASQELFIYGRVINTGTNSLSALKMSIAMANVSFADMETSKLWGDKMAGMFRHSAVLPTTGVSTGTSLNWGSYQALPAQTTTNSQTALPTGAAAGLGGYQRIAHTTAYTVDYAWLIYSYQIPAVITAAPISASQNLYITGVYGYAISRGAAGTNSTIIPVAIELNYGGTNINQSTAEAITTNTTPVKGTRRIPIGKLSVPINAAIGSDLGSINWQPTIPVVAEAGTFVQIMIRPLVAWTLNTSQEIVFSMHIDGYWE